MPAKRALALRGARWAAFALLSAAACRPADLEDSWTCDFDASEGRPLDDPDALTGDAGALPASDCMNTCGPPVTACNRIVLDGGLAGALCPVCTF